MHILEYTFMVHTSIRCHSINYFVVLDLHIGNWYLKTETVGTTGCNPNQTPYVEVLPIKWMKPLIPIVSQTNLRLEILHHQNRASGIVEVYIKTSLVVGKILF